MCHLASHLTGKYDTRTHSAHSELLPRMVTRLSYEGRLASLFTLTRTHVRNNLQPVRWSAEDGCSQLDLGR